MKAGFLIVFLCRVFLGFFCDDDHYHTDSDDYYIAL
jgi:hypothetical protein